MEALFAFYPLILMLHILGILLWVSDLFAQLAIFIAGYKDVQEEKQKALLAIQKKVYRMLSVPGSAITFIFGFMLAIMSNYWTDLWFVYKLILVIILVLIDVYLIKRINKLRASFEEAEPDIVGAEKMHGVAKVLLLLTIIIAVAIVYLVRLRPV